VANIPKDNIHELQGKRRQRAIYFRPVVGPNGAQVWVPTDLLPSDTLGREQYLTKGFRLTQPAETELPAVVQETKAPNENLQPCPHCDFVAKSKFGLRAHMRTKHKKIK
jgi:hypothetical protein